MAVIQPRQARPRGTMIRTTDKNVGPTKRSWVDPMVMGKIEATPKEVRQFANKYIGGLDRQLVTELIDERTPGVIASIAYRSGVSVDLVNQALDLTRLIRSV